MDEIYMFLRHGSELQGLAYSPQRFHLSHLGEGASPAKMRGLPLLVYVHVAPFIGMNRGGRRGERPAASSGYA